MDASPTSTEEAANQESRFVGTGFMAAFGAFVLLACSMIFIAAPLAWPFGLVAAGQAFLTAWGARGVLRAFGRPDVHLPFLLLLGASFIGCWVLEMLVLSVAAKTLGLSNVIPADSISAASKAAACALFIVTGLVICRAILGLNWADAAILFIVSGSIALVSGIALSVFVLGLTFNIALEGMNQAFRLLGFFLPPGSPSD